jgi:hypothetical protein
MKKFLTTLALITLAPAVASAQGTSAERAACTGDAFRICSAFIPNVSQITACMIQNKSQLSAACRLVMDSEGQNQKRSSKIIPARE